MNLKKCQAYENWKEQQGKKLEITAGLLEEVTRLQEQYKEAKVIYQVSTENAIKAELAGQKPKHSDADLSKMDEDVKKVKGQLDKASMKLDIFNSTSTVASLNVDQMTQDFNAYVAEVKAEQLQPVLDRLLVKKQEFLDVVTEYNELVRLFTEYKRDFTNDVRNSSYAVHHIELVHTADIEKYFVTDADYNKVGGR